MNPEQFQAEKQYQTALNIAKSMLKLGLVTPEEFSSTVTILRGKFPSISCALYPVKAP